jgi:4-amino-4-deoxy-L-arabinose transferase-like glycosyltransferase
LAALFVLGLGVFAVIWSFPHYAAPMTATVFAVLMQSMRHLRRWKIKGREAGILLSRVVVLLVLARTAIYTVRPPAMQEAWSRDRARIVRQLEATTSDHLVLVRYGPRHNVHNDWVWNAADIDHSRIVWAREIPGVDLQPLLDYFRGRKVWVIEPDAEPLQLKELSEDN